MYLVCTALYLLLTYQVCRKEELELDNFSFKYNLFFNDF